MSQLAKIKRPYYELNTYLMPNKMVATFAKPFELKKIDISDAIQLAKKCLILLWLIGEGIFCWIAAYFGSSLHDVASKLFCP